MCPCDDGNRTEKSRARDVAYRLGGDGLRSRHEWHASHLFRSRIFRYRVLP
jgi:hypothetical protein